MADVFKKESVEELYVQLSDGRMMLLADIVRDYERLLKENASKKAIISEPKDDKAITKELEVGKWFRIDRDVIARNREKICRVCNEAGDVGKAYWKRFEESNKIADENPDQYPRIIETYIFKHDWEYKTEQEMRDMCKEIGDGECDEVICDLELQMRICNGESAHALFELYNSEMVELAVLVAVLLTITITQTFAGTISILLASTTSTRRMRSVECFRSTEHCFVLLKPKQN